MAFLHHVAAFTLVGSLSAEMVLFKPPLTTAQARRVLGADAIFGISAGTLLIVGLLRVFYFEKGAAYYFANGFFIVKLSLFILAALLSIYPTRLFLSWRPLLKQGTTPSPSPEQTRRARMCIMWELTAILGILLCAPFMAQGLGMLR
ncbi:MAG TPA: DUF2214 family protein [Steroidobacteraceae bacterium]|nr:DUF2214 family protein [Steroidobacteraceae bacterium]